MIDEIFKYVIFDAGVEAGGEQALMFPINLEQPSNPSHADVWAQFSGGMTNPPTPSRAGFGIHSGDMVLAYGQSDTLGLQSNPEADAAVIRRTLAIQAYRAQYDLRLRMAEQIRQASMARRQAISRRPTMTGP